MSGEPVAPRVTEEVQLRKFDLNGDLIEEISMRFVDGELQEES